MSSWVLLALGLAVHLPSPWGQPPLPLEFQGSQLPLTLTARVGAPPFAVQ